MSVVSCQKGLVFVALRVMRDSLRAKVPTLDPGFRRDDGAMARLPHRPCNEWSTCEVERFELTKEKGAAGAGKKRIVKERSRNEEYEALSGRGGYC